MSHAIHDSVWVDLWYWVWYKKKKKKKINLSILFFFRKWNFCFIFLIFLTFGLNRKHLRLRLIYFSSLSFSFRAVCKRSARFLVCSTKARSYFWSGVRGISAGLPPPMVTHVVHQYTVCHLNNVITARKFKSFFLFPLIRNIKTQYTHIHTVYTKIIKWLDIITDASKYLKSEYKSNKRWSWIGIQSYRESAAIFCFSCSVENSEQMAKLSHHLKRAKQKTCTSKWLLKSHRSQTLGFKSTGKQLLCCVITVL